MTDKSKLSVYLKVLITLAVSTIIEVIVGGSAESWGLSAWTKFSVLFGIAVFKGSLIVAFFMHVKYEPRPWLLIALVFGLPLFVTLPVALFPVFFA